MKKDPFTRIIGEKTDKNVFILDSRMKCANQMVYCQCALYNFLYIIL